MSDAEAYAAYGRESGPVFSRLGGRIIWRGQFENKLIGQLVARCGDEATLFRLSAQLERARPWFDRKPPVAG